MNEYDNLNIALRRLARHAWCDLLHPMYYYLSRLEHMLKHRFIFALAFLSITVPVYAKCLVPKPITDAFRNGSPELAFRFRQEDSKQAGLQAGNASTLRTTVGFETAEFYHSVFKVELVDVAHFFGLHYNPGVSDLLRPQYTLIPDPPGAGITEAKLTYTGLARNEITFGHQYINLDNQRFIGANDFRQYPQSFDALSINNTWFDCLELFYAYLIAVNTNNSNGRALAGQRQLSSNLVNVDWTGTKFGIGGYIYFNCDHTVNTNSNITFGLRLLSPEDLDATNGYAFLFEVARQRSRFNNPVSYTAYYMHCYLSKTLDFVTGLIGLERLSGNSYAPNKVFITPMGSVDNFNGMAQVFTTPPSRGLQDYYATLSGTTHDITAGITYHLFLLDKGPGSRLAGNEFDIFADFKVTNQIDFSIAYANYTAQNNVAPNTRRFWVMITANLL